MRWWRVFIDGLSAQGEDEISRRRRSERYGYEVKLGVRCSSWPSFVDLFTGDVSEGGLYIPTDQAAEVGEPVQLDVQLPTGTKIALTGRVVSRVQPDPAAHHHKLPGLGIRLDPLAGDAKETFDKLLETARASQLRPADELADGEPIPSPPQTPDVPLSGELRISAFQQIVDPSPSPLLPLAPAVERFHIPSSAPIRRPTGMIVGIDMGTTNTSVACTVKSKVAIVEREDGSRVTPSIIAIDQDGSITVGTEARRRAATDPAHTVVSPKRLLGRRHDDRDLEPYLAQAPYRTSAAPDGSIVIEMWGREYGIEALCSHLLAEARNLAEGVTGAVVRQAVVAVPITFDDDRIAALRRAGQLAELDIVAVIDEPSAAALANRYDRDFGGTVGIYDFGGGTFDFSIVDVSGGDFRVLATVGDTWLGGDDLDRVLAEAAANQFWREHKIDLRKQPIDWQRLVFACERAKRDLSAADSSIVSVPDILRTADGMIGLHLGATRALFERACAPIIQRTLDTCNEALALVGLERGQLSAVYISGGSTYVPVVRRALHSHFGVPVRAGVPPEYAVCLGAAIHAAQMLFGAQQTLETR